MSGWEDFEDVQPSDRRDVTQKRDDLDRLFLRVFGTEDGKELMAVLRNMYIEPTIATPGVDPSFAFFREGARSVIQDIEAKLRRARNG